MSAFAALVLLGVASSCKDQNFDWDEAHATQQYQKFTDVFIKEFGKPQNGHMWGFDTPWNDISSTKSFTRATRATGEPIFAKMELGWNMSLAEIVSYGPVNCITEHEHNEVYEWFSKHQVTWEETSTTSAPVYFDGVNCTRHPENPKQAVKLADLSSNNSLNDYTPEYWLGNPYVGLTLDADKIWVQSVASYSDPGTWTGKPSDGSIENDEQDLSNPGKKSQGMDYLEVGMGLNSFTHSNDFNGGGGYGQNTAKGTYGYMEAPYQSIIKNADLFIANGSNFNNFCTNSSGDGGNLRHDKWIIVYLKGDDYEGWYLGMDTEAGGANNNMRIPANGICNDWIFKISTTGGNRNKARIMCEDLGSTEGVNASDIDYNDIVFDVDYETLESYNGSTFGSVSITARAAGGTLPLIVCYEDTPLFESHEFMRNENVYGVKKEEDAFYKKMINTHAEDYDLDGIDNVPSRSYTLFFNNTDFSYISGQIYTGAANQKKISGVPPTWEQIKDKLKVKVYRFDRSDYLTGSSTGTIDLAAWITLQNDDGSAPVRICVDQSVRWLKERQKVTLGYPSFTNWVKNQNEYFWTKSGDAVEEYLCEQTGVSSSSPNASPSPTPTPTPSPTPTPDPEPEPVASTSAASTNDLNVWGGASITKETSGGVYSFKINNPQSGENDWSAQVVALNYNFVKGTTYTVKLRYKTSESATGSVKLIIQNSSNYADNTVGSPSVPTSNWKEETFCVTCDKDGVDRLLINVGHLIGDFYLEYINIY